MTLDHELLAAALPRYEIGEEIGRGGFGVVLRGFHRGLGRDVAIKQLTREFGADASVRERFIDEARLVAGLDHPHIVPVFDFVEHEGLCAIVMEFAPGGTLWVRFKQKGLETDEVISVILAAAVGLHHAHEHGVLHRDVKPDNVLFSATGTPKVADFGIAKALGEEAVGRTATGSILGTPAYMSPEQVSGGDLSPRTDIYALGVMLYELLTGELPYRPVTDAVAQLFQHVHEEPRRMHEVLPGVHPALEQVTLRALAKDPADRPESAEAFAVDLAEAASRVLGPGWLGRGGFAVMSATAVVAATERASSTYESDDRDKTVFVEGREDQPRLRAPTVADGPPTDMGPPGAGDHDDSELELVPPDAEERRPRGPRRAFTLVAFAVFLVAAAVAGLILLPDSDDADDETGERSIEVIATIPVGADPDLSIEAGEFLWTPNREGASVSVIDLETREVVDTISVGDRPARGIVVEGFLWIPNFRDGTISVIDPEAREVIDTVEVGPGASHLTLAGGLVWSRNRGDRAVVAVDPLSHEVVADVPLGPNPFPPVEAGGLVWVPDQGDGTLRIVDPERQVVINTLAIGTSLQQPTSAFEIVWVPDRDEGTVTAIDIATQEVLDTIAVGSGPGPATAASDLLWVPNAGDGTISVIDPTTREIVDTVAVGASPRPPTGAGGLLWVPNTGDATVTAIDPASREVVDTVDVGSGPTVATEAGGFLWVPNVNDGTVSVIASSPGA